MRFVKTRLVTILARWAGGVLLAVVVVFLTGRVFAAETPCPAASHAMLDLPAMRTALSHDQDVTIVALGSSSTEGAGASSLDRTYPARLEARLRATWPDIGVTVLNRGVGGQTVEAVVPRIPTDVIATHPTLVIWQIGTNEAMRALDPARFEALLDEGLRMLAPLGADIVLMDYQLALRMPPDDVTAVYGDVIARQAKLHGVPLFSRAALMRDWRVADPTANDMIGPDGLHHTDRGYACVAAALGSAIVAGSGPKIAAVHTDVK